MQISPILLGDVDALCRTLEPAAKLAAEVMGDHPNLAPFALYSDWEGRNGAFSWDDPQFPKQASRLFGDVRRLTPEEEASGDWVKIAVSPMLNAGARLLHYLPWQVGEYKLEPRPLTSMLAGAALGGTAGYLGGAAMDWMRGAYPEESVKNRWALAGAGLGALPGAAWLGSRGIRQVQNGGMSGLLSPKFLGEALTNPYDDQVVGWKDASAHGSSDFAIDVDRLGRVLWEGEASPMTWAATMASAEAAARLGGGQATPHGYGLLGSLLGTAGGGIQGYVAGRAVGAGLGLLTGLDSEEQRRLGRAGFAGGVAGTLMGRLFER